MGVRPTYAAPDATAATRTDTPPIDAPQSVEVITRGLIQEQDRRTLGDALVNGPAGKNQPGSPFAGRPRSV